MKIETVPVCLTQIVLRKNRNAQNLIHQSRMQGRQISDTDIDLLRILNFTCPLILHLQVAGITVSILKNTNNNRIKI